MNTNNIKRIIRETVNESQLLTEDYYCNEGGRAINGPRCMRCAQSGGPCPCIGDGYFDYLKYNGGGHETGWSCGSVRQLDDYEYDKEFDREIDIEIDRPVRMTKRGMRESDFSRIVKRTLNEEPKKRIKGELGWGTKIRRWVDSNLFNLGEDDATWTCKNGKCIKVVGKGGVGEFETLQECEDSNCEERARPIGGRDNDYSMTAMDDNQALNEIQMCGENQNRNHGPCPRGMTCNKCSGCGTNSDGTPFDAYRCENLDRGDDWRTRGPIGPYPKPAPPKGKKAPSAFIDERKLSESRLLREEKMLTCPCSGEKYWSGSGPSGPNCHEVTCPPGSMGIQHGSSPCDRTCHDGYGDFGGKTNTKNDYEDIQTDIDINEPRMVKEEIVKARRLMGYNTSLPLTEQTTGGNTPMCMSLTAQGCPGTPTGNVQITSILSKCASIGQVPVTPSDVGRDIMVNGIHVTVQTVSANPTGSGYQNFTPASGPCPRTTGGPTTGGTVDCYQCVNGTPTVVETIGPGSPWCQSVPGAAAPQCGTDCTQIQMNNGQFPLTSDPNMPCTGGPTPPPQGFCNKSCIQLIPNFKQKVNGKSCNWLRNRLLAFTQKIETKTYGSCGFKRLTCKISIIQQNLQNLGC